MSPIKLTSKRRRLVNTWSIPYESGIRTPYTEIWESNIVWTIICIFMAYSEKLVVTNTSIWPKIRIKVFLVEGLNLKNVNKSNRYFNFRLEK